MNRHAPTETGNACDASLLIDRLFDIVCRQILLNGKNIIQTAR
jgi:hypothetical protein